MLKQRSGRNRTLTLDENEINYYLNRCANIDNIDKQVPISDLIVHGDALSVSAKLPDNFVDLLIVDPPYNINKTFGDSRFKKMSSDEYVIFTNQWISQILHTLKPFASIYVCCDWRSSIVIGGIIQRYFNIQNRITWQREKGRGAIRNWKNAMEDIWFATISQKNYTFNVESVKTRRKVIAPYKVDGKPKDWIGSTDGNFRDTYPSNLWDDISIPYWSMPENTNHPTQKPEKLIAKLILASSNVGDMVLDPFLGSGTTAVVAKKLKRHFLGIESEREYCALSQKRLELAADNPEIQGYSGNIFWERNTLASQQKFKDNMRSSFIDPVFSRHSI
ncbi:MAG: hypothetical protein LBB52_09310 [Desulfovibrio sp.]|jgi:site-specific DNA-methyltransferase (adenine-specific)|nr:hypothetical protein [Desulfovibrio sp.]